MSRRERNAEQVRKYLEVVMPKCERPTQGVVNMEEVLSSGAKPDSKPPIPDHGLDLIDHPDNRHAAARIKPALNWLAVTHGHLHFVTRSVAQDPAAPRSWTEDSPEAGLYRKAIAKIEEYIEWRWTATRLHVAVDPKDEPAESKRDAYLKDVKLDAQSAYAILSEAVDIKMAEDRSKTAAVHEVAEEWDTSPARVWRALGQRSA